jgi:hypothetical protein
MSGITAAERGPENEDLLQFAYEALDYNWRTGEFRWKKRVGQRGSPGKTAGSTCSKGYLHIQLWGRTIPGHRLAVAMVDGRWPSGPVDHIDGNPGNNALANLRETTQLVNAHNQRRVRKTNPIGFHGVVPVQRVRTPPRYQAKIMIAGRRYYLGVYENPLLAMLTYVAAKNHLGYFQHS